MAKSHFLRHLVSTVAVVVLILITTADAGTWMPRTTCQGSIDGGGEFEMEYYSEMNPRRILASTNYISYGALQANHVPCSQKGASYYNCQPGAEANPYTRSCTAATQCRND